MREKDAVVIILASIIMAIIWPGRKKLMFWIVDLILIVMLVTISAMFVKYIKKRSSRLMPEKWDQMSGVEFEAQIATWLKSFYSQVKLTEYYDSGIDIIAAKSGKLFGIQVKRSSGKVGVAAVRAAVTGLSHYGCSTAMVITNSNFTNAAIRLANENNCILIDGNQLRRSINSIPPNTIDEI